MGLTIGLLNVRRSILIQASPQRVWQEFESFDQIAAWFGLGPAVVIGGIGTLVVVAVGWFLFPALREGSTEAIFKDSHVTAQRRAAAAS